MNRGQYSAMKARAYVRGEGLLENIRHVQRGGGFNI